jgi:uncharacterized protein with GYD domain
MALYMLQASYTSEAWAAMAHRPTDREQAFRELVEGLGGQLLGFYFCLGDYDVVATYEAGDSAKATGIAIAANAAGHLRAIKTTPLTTTADAMVAMQVAGTVDYRAPRVSDYPAEPGVYEGAQGDTPQQFGTLEEAIEAMEAATRHIASRSRR